MLHIQVSGQGGVGLYSPKTVEELEKLLEEKVVLLKRPISNIGLGGVVNVFKTAADLNIHIDIGDKDDSWDFLLMPDKELDKQYIKSQQRDALWKIRRWSDDDRNYVELFFHELLNEAGWPSKTGNPSGKVRYNNI